MAFGGTTSRQLRPLVGKQLSTRLGEEVMSKFINRFIKDESGATAIEYGLIAALIAVVIIAATQALGTNVSGKFQEAADGIANA